jgi:hypothetical protein
MKKFNFIVFISFILFSTSVLNAEVGLLLVKSKSAEEKSLKYGSVAVNNSITGVYSNPAVVANLNYPAGVISYISYIASINMFYGDIVYPINNFNINGRFGYAGMESIEDTTTGETLKFREMYIGLGTGYILPYNIVIGANANFFSASLTVLAVMLTASLLKGRLPAIG